MLISSKYLKPSLHSTTEGKIMPYDRQGAEGPHEGGQPRKWGWFRKGG